MKNAKKWWRRFVKKALPTLFYTNFTILCFSVIIWVLGQNFGEGNEFYFDYFLHGEWTLTALLILLGINYARSTKAVKEKRQVWPIGLAVLLASLFSGVLIDMGYQLIGPLFGMEYNFHIMYFDIELPAYVTNSVSYFFWGLVIAVPVSIHHVTKFKYELTLKVKELEQDRLKKMKDLAQLELLRAKVNPHFMYNAFNSIASLIHTDASRAEQMLLALSELLRHSLNSGDEHFATVADEIQITERYLEVEKIRFEDQLKVDIKVDKDCLTLKIPKFIVQPLVENAIIHGTSKVDKGLLLIDVHKEQNELIVSIRDNGPDFEEGLTMGYGMSGVIEKLKLLLGDAGHFELQNGKNKGVEIRIRHDEE
jgi:anti-sigma regulatory factor (Ser/Thr protein kinase)